MAVNPKRRQRKLEKKRAERKAEKKLIARQQSKGLVAKFRDAAGGRVLHCAVSQSIWETGIGQVWVSRELPGARVGFVSFLVDIFCLGVKDCLGSVSPRHEYFERYSQFTEKFDCESLSIECARKLVEGSIEFAAQVDIHPHPDYEHFRLIFGDADVAACTREFSFGRDGKHLYVQGPFDSESRTREILAKLYTGDDTTASDFIISLAGDSEELDESDIDILEMDEHLRIDHHPK